jgi:O-antigen/teichoic acid export membrane protein
VIFTFWGMDVLLAKLFFADNIAGAYAVASTLAKTIFFGTHPISRAMFPLTAEHEKNSKKSENVFKNALALILVALAAALIMFYLFPAFLIKVFSGKIIDDSAKILVYIGIAISLVSLTNLVLLYKLSIGKIKKSSVKIYLGAAILLALGVVLVLLYYYQVIAPLVVYALSAGIVLFFTYCLIKKYDVGLFLFIIIEVILFELFNADLMQFSRAFITAAAVFLFGAVVLLGEDRSN